jgi:translation initiation factor IF-2
LQNGILKKGDIIATSSVVGKIKNLENFEGIPIDKALPAMPVIIIGFEDIPIVGDIVKQFDTIEEARQNINKEKETKNSYKITSIDADKKVLNLILKADVFGSLEALKNVLETIPQDKVVLKIVKEEVGDINENDIKLAKGTNAIIIGFRVKINPAIKNIADREKITIKVFDIIYELVKATRAFLEKIIEPEIIRIDLGKIKILKIFLTEKNRQIIGGKVIEGKAKKGAKVEVYRNEEKIGDGKIINLQRDKKETDEVIKGSECGLLYEGNIKIEEEDILAIYSEEKRKIEI